MIFSVYVCIYRHKHCKIVFVMFLFIPVCQTPSTATEIIFCDGNNI
jgi:hypothetical protein